MKRRAYLGMAVHERHVKIGELVLMLDLSTGLTINDVPKKNKKGKRVA